MEQQREQALRGVFHLLEHTAKIAEDAALTGTFGSGEARCISQFNNALRHLSDLHAIPAGLFEELPTDASFGQIGIACHQLAAYLNEELEATPDFKGWVSSFFGKRFVENLTDELTDKPFSEFIRKAVPDFLTETTLEDIVEVFPVAPGGRLTLAADFGTLDVKSTESDEVAIRVARTSESQADRRAAELLKAFDIRMQHEAADVTIEAKFRGSIKQWKKMKKRLDVHFDIRVPRNYGLDLKTADADIAVRDIVGDVNARTAGADLRFQNITGRIDGTTSGGTIDLKTFESDATLQTSGGDITLEAGSGTIQAKTSGGHIHIVDVAGAVNGRTSGGNITLLGCKGGADVKTAGGSIEIENDGPVLAKNSGGAIQCQLGGTLPTPSVLLDLETTGGSINVGLPDIAATVDARVLGGSVTTEFPVATETAGIVKPDQLRGTLNGGGPMLRLFCVGGNIILRKASAAG